METFAKLSDSSSHTPPTRQIMKVKLGQLIKMAFDEVVN